MGNVLVCSQGEGSVCSAEVCDDTDGALREVAGLSDGVFAAWFGLYRGGDRQACRLFSAVFDASAQPADPTVHLVRQLFLHYLQREHPVGGFAHVSHLLAGGGERSRVQ